MLTRLKKRSVPFNVPWISGVTLARDMARIMLHPLVTKKFPDHVHVTEREAFTSPFLNPLMPLTGNQDKILAAGLRYNRGNGLAPVMNNVHIVRPVHAGQNLFNNLRRILIPRIIVSQYYPLRETFRHGPIAGRFALSRLPPHPKTHQIAPSACGRNAVSAISNACPVWA